MNNEYLDYAVSGIEKEEAFGRLEQSFKVFGFPTYAKTAHKVPRVICQIRISYIHIF